MKIAHPSLFALAFTLAMSSVALGAESPWRYYRPGNTGIQGDFNETIYIGADRDPWIGGYDPISEEGGIAKFIQSQNRWLNVSNVDYSVIGNANDVGVSRATDMIEDGIGNLWIGTYRGVLRMNLATGPGSLVKFGPLNSTVADGRVTDLSLAPDGTIWVSGDGGLNRYNPNTNLWTAYPTRGGDKIAVQPKTGGGYYLWTSPPGHIQSPVERWNSSTNTWTTYATTSGNPSHLLSKSSVDAVGNLWMRRWIGIQNEEQLGYYRTDGVWVTTPVPPANGLVSLAAILPYGNTQALMVDGFMQLQKFNGVSWTNLGPVPHSGFIDDLDMDSLGNVWLCGTGTGGALRRDVTTGGWQRYRITNTSQFDLFNTDLTIDPNSNTVFACANANSDTGGMVQFDGIRWKGYVTGLGYGLSGPWPFAGSPQSEAIYRRPSNGQLVVNPINNFTHALQGTSWKAILGGPDQVQNYVEDSRGRLWCAGHYGGVGVLENNLWTKIEGGDWGNKVYLDPQRKGTVWATMGSNIVRTDGVYRFARSIADFPELSLLGASFQGFAVQPNGTAWVGTVDGNTGAGNALVKIDPITGKNQIVFRYGVNWPFPGKYVEPFAVTPDGRVWMKYGKEYPFDEMGICWWDGYGTGSYPAPPNGEWRFGGLPHYIISDVEVKPIQGGYELWMACFSRGIAVLTVRNRSRLRI